MVVGLIRTLRPHQWVKNVFVLAPLVFAQELAWNQFTLKALGAFGLFCLASSTVYVFNDILDVEADRAHPIKSKRPIPSGDLPMSVAKTTAVVLGLASLIGAYFLEPLLAAAIGGYLLLNLAYSTRLKQIPYIDVLCITTGFELRVIGGAIAAEVEPSAYLLVATFLLASFLGFGKRMHELLQGKDAKKQRKVLSKYDEKTLSILLHLTALFSVATYVVYTLDPSTREAFKTDYLVVTSLMPIIGVLRFLHLVRRQHKSDSPTEDMLKDWPFILNFLLYVAAVIGVIYFFPR
ncbi:MAG: decaprenyl-phosphate phosphoribosyltransferase [Myxococcota bacterium]